MSTEFRYDVFLSHSTKDKALVRPLADRLPADALKARIRIAVAGKSGAGKTELANYLARKLGIIRASTGDIYRAISTILYGEIRKDQMNMLTAALRGIDANCVLKAALRNSDSSSGIVFDSMRFTEDYSFLQGQGFVFVRVNSTPEVRHRRLRQRGEVFAPNELEADPTETELDSVAFDCVLTNEGSDLPTFLDSAFRQIRRFLRFDL